MIPFETVLTLSRTGDDSATFELPPEWAQGRSAFGGVVAGIGARVASSRLAADRPIRSVLVDFAAPIAPGQASTRVRVLREGRSLSHIEVQVLQGGELAAVVLVTAGTTRHTAISLTPPAPPVSTPPESSTMLPFIEGATPTFTKNFEYRWSSARFPFTGADRANLGGWIRRRDGGPVDAAGVLALIDAWPAPVLPLLTRPAAASTVTWLVNFAQEVPAEGWPGDAFFRFEADAVAASGGYADASGRLWGPDGGLVASSTQLVAEFSS
jgi:acyl-CoA thioesterase